MVESTPWSWAHLILHLFLDGLRCHEALQLILMLPAQTHLCYFNISSLIHLLVMFFIAPTLVTQFKNPFLYLSSNMQFIVYGGLFKKHHFLLWWYSKVFAFWPVCNNIQNFWMTRFSYWSLLCDQCDTLTPRSTSYKTHRRKHPFEQQPLQCQGNLCFRTGKFWSSPNPCSAAFICGQFFFQFFVSLTSILKSSLKFSLMTRARGSRLGHSPWLPCKAHFYCITAWNISWLIFLKPVII